MLDVSNTLWYDGIIYMQDVSKISFCLHFFSQFDKYHLKIWLCVKFCSRSKRIIQNALLLTIWYHFSTWWSALFAKTSSQIAQKMQFFKTPFFSIIERFWTFPKNFSYDQIFWNVKCVMCGSNLASYIPPSGALGISLPSLDIRGISPLQYSKVKSRRGDIISKVKSHRGVKNPVGGISQEILKKVKISRGGYVRRPIWTTHNPWC